MSWFKIKEKIKFYWQAKNAHGLHSPFVFDFYNALKKQAKSTHFPSESLLDFSKKETRIIGVLQNHLKPNHALVVSSEEQELNNWNSFLAAETEVSSAKSLNELPLKPTIFDWIILSKSLVISRKEFFDKILPRLSNDTVVIIPHIHASKNAISQWESLREEKSVRLSMDVFFIGLLFFRKESAKQDFQLRF